MLPSSCRHARVPFSFFQRRNISNQCRSVAPPVECFHSIHCVDFFLLYYLNYFGGPLAQRCDIVLSFQAFGGKHVREMGLCQQWGTRQRIRRSHVCMAAASRRTFSSSDASCIAAKREGLLFVACSPANAISSITCDYHIASYIYTHSN